MRAGGPQERAPRLGLAGRLASGDQKPRCAPAEAPCRGRVPRRPGNRRLCPGCCRPDSSICQRRAVFADRRDTVSNRQHALGDCAERGSPVAITLMARARGGGRRRLSQAIRRFPGNAQHGEGFCFQGSFVCSLLGVRTGTLEMCFGLRKPQEGAPIVLSPDARVSGYLGEVTTVTPWPLLKHCRPGCGSAWKIDPHLGVIGVKSDPP